MNKKLNKIIEIANRDFDGEFTLHKFTTNCRGCFGSVDKIDDFSNFDPVTWDVTDYLPPFETLDELFDAMIDNPEKFNTYNLAKIRDKAEGYIL